MSDPVINGNLNSVILNSLYQSEKTDLKYRLTGNFPNLSKQLVQLTPNIGSSVTGSGQIITWNLPRYGTMTDLLVQSTVASAGGAASALTAGSTANTNYNQIVYLGLCLFSTLYLMSNNKIVCSNSDKSAQVDVRATSLAKSMGDKRRAMIFSTDGTTLASGWASGASVITYTPFYSSLLYDGSGNQEVGQYLDLNYVQPLQFQATTNTASEIGLPSGVTLGTVTSTLWLYYYNLYNEDLLKLRAMNFPQGGVYNVLSYDQYTETGTITSGNTASTAIKIFPQCVNCSAKTYIYIKDTQYNQMQAIGSVTVKMGGKVIYSASNNTVLNKENDEKLGGSLLTYDQFDSVALSASTQYGNNLVSMERVQPIVIDWGLMTDNSYNSGSVSLQNIPNFEIDVFTSGTATQYWEWVVVNKFFTLLQVNPADGNVSVSQTS